jgi:DNA-directed RNA polymerase subunit E'/Rpb7
MYSIIKQNDKVSINPEDITNDISGYTKNSLIKKFEGSILSSGIYIVKIIDVNPQTIINGTINDLNGSIVYDIEYTAFIFDPNDTSSSFDVHVTKFNDIGIWGYPVICSEKSCVSCIASSDFIAPAYVFTENGYKHSVGRTDTALIKVGSIIKFKIINKQIENASITIFGNIV